MTESESNAPFLTEEKFSIEVEKHALSNSTTLLEAIAELVDLYDIEPEEVKKYISKTLYQKLEAECNSSGLLVNQEKSNLEVFLN